MVSSFDEHLKAKKVDRVARGNLRARARMVVLYFVANTEDRVVMGTGNKSELLCGYFTRYGDGGVDFQPIGDLYKTQVRAMARHLGLPKKIIDRVPTAGLWPGQTDEGDLGISYDELDRILLGIELQMEPEGIAEKAGVPVEHVRRIEDLVAATAYKRKAPLVPKLGIRTLGLDWRE
jgi:NAD+ synthase